MPYGCGPQSNTFANCKSQGLYCGLAKRASAGIQCYTEYQCRTDAVTCPTLGPPAPPCIGNGRVVRNGVCQCDFAGNWVDMPGVPNGCGCDSANGYFEMASADPNNGKPRCYPLEPYGCGPKADKTAWCKMSNNYCGMRRSPGSKPDCFSGPQCDNPSQVQCVGYEGPPRCQEESCAPGEQCIIVDRRIKCSCKPNHTPSPAGGCAPIPRNKCKPNPCGRNAQCYRSGSRSNNPKVCGHRGSCTVADHGQGYICACKRGYTFRSDGRKGCQKDRRRKRGRRLPPPPPPRPDLSWIDPKLPPKGPPRAAADVEDCVACRYIWSQVEADIGNTAIENDVYLSYKANAKDAETQPIFYPSIQTMFDMIDDMIGDYMDGYSVNQLCENSNMCRPP
jgi:hypothetical protein